MQLRVRIGWDSKGRGFFNVSKGKPIKTGYYNLTTLLKLKGVK